MRLANTKLNALRIGLLFPFLICQCFISQPAAGQSTEREPVGAKALWKVGLAQQKITPQQRVYLAGYASRNKPFESVADDLFVKAIALEDAVGNQAILVTSDVIGYRAEFSEQICQQVCAKTGLLREQILLNSSHTHTGPTLSLDPEPRARDMTPEQAMATVAYTKQLIHKTAVTAIEAHQNLRPARVSYGVGVAKFVMNRREYTPRGVRLGVNPRGLADRGVPVLRVEKPDGKLLAILYQVACHNTTLTGRDYMISGDFAGISQSLIQQKYPGVQAMFMAGCGGSSNPYPRGDLEHAQSHAAQLSAEVSRVLEGDLQSVSGPLRTELAQVDLPLQRPPTEKQLDQLTEGRSGWQPWVAQQMKQALERDGELPRSYQVPVAVWQFGSDLTLVGLPGEVVVDYVTLIERAVGPLNLWTAAYCNDVFGYIPSRQVLLDGGYETRGLYSGGIGFFAPNAEEVLVSAVRELATKAGRNVPPGR